MRDLLDIFRPFPKMFCNFSVESNKGNADAVLFSALGPEVREQIKLVKYDNKA